MQEKECKPITEKFIEKFLIEANWKSYVGLIIEFLKKVKIENDHICC